MAPLLALAASTSPLTAGQSFSYMEFQTELTSMSLTGGPFPMPLAFDPTNNLGDSVDGYGFVNSSATFNLSSERTSSPGSASLGSYDASPNAPPTEHRARRRPGDH